MHRREKKLIVGKLIVSFEAVEEACLTFEPENEFVVTICIIVIDFFRAGSVIAQT